MSRAGPNNQVEPTRKAVEEALKRALAHEGIASSSQLSRFLDFVVTKKLDGEEEDIKAYTIAVDALGRNESFDPQESAVVRVAAGRLRQVLALHNASLEKDEGVRIILEPGSYVPVFKMPHEDETQLLLADDVLDDDNADNPVLAPDVPQSPSETIVAQTAVQTDANNKLLRWLMAAIAVLGLMVFAIWATLFFRDGRTDGPNSQTTELIQQDAGYLPRISAVVRIPEETYPEWFKIGELVDTVGLVVSRFDDYQFIGVERSKDENATSPTDADFHLDISARARDDKLRIFATLTHVLDGRVLWSITRDFNKPENLSDRNVEEIVGRISSALASPYGVIFTDLANHKISRTSLSCVISGYQYFYSESNAKHKEARACAEAAVERGTRLPIVYAMLTFLYLDEYREGRNRRERDPLKAAGIVARKAVQFGPKSARSHQALFAFYKVRGKRDEARKAARAAIALNPYDSDILGDYAAWLLSVGELEEGKTYLDKAEAVFSARPAWFEFYRFLNAQLTGDVDGASEIAKFLDISRSPLLALAAVVGAHHRGDEDVRHRAMLELFEMEPAFRTDPEGQLAKRGFDPSVIEKLVRSLRGAGL